MYNFTIVSFHFLLIKKNILYMYKITVVPFTKMLNSQSAFMASSWIKNKMRKIFQKFMIFVEYRNYNARGLIVKYVYFVLISILNIYLSTGSSLSETPGHILPIKIFLFKRIFWIKMSMRTIWYMWKWSCNTYFFHCFCI